MVVFVDIVTVLVSVAVGDRGGGRFAFERLVRSADRCWFLEGGKGGGGDVDRVPCWEWFTLDADSIVGRLSATDRRGLGDIDINIGSSSGLILITSERRRRRPRGNLSQRRRRRDERLRKSN